MLSHFVTAARGLFARQDSGAEEETPPSPDQTTNPIPSNPSTKMVSATRRTVFSTTTAEVDVDSSPATNGKRKITTSKRETESQAPKRRKQKGPNSMSSLAAESVDAEKSIVKKLPFRTADSSDIVDPETQPGEEKSGPSTSSSKERDEVTTDSNAKSTHVRFGNEDPALEVNGHNERVMKEEKPKASRDVEDSDDDDEAPETVDNTAQLRKLKDAARKEAQAKQRTDALNKGKRRERDQRLKAQAVSKSAPPIKQQALPIPQDHRAKQDEILSESSATLQGSISKPIRSLPTLLPDEILNAEPSFNHSRIPTPPYEIESSLTDKISKKHKFLDKVEKKPKDIKIGGGTSIRVLESSSSSGSGGVSLPPKSSKASRRVRERLIATNRSLPGGGSLRRTTGGTTGFVRK
ncbi:hypothetical protein EMCG_07970 [[Emmonsia] crescens]|uniref:Uncharacterized protein n=1 Tax=[Emmonsia] crescens TaxID=73230 RepID=A0A0G2JAT8_9EURO|nr:hypothetical protein EMCG_07970 [Emmonsia crescens UAMH 3008]